MEESDNLSSLVVILLAKNGDPCCVLRFHVSPRQLGDLHAQLWSDWTTRKPLKRTFETAVGFGDWRQVISRLQGPILSF